MTAPLLHQAYGKCIELWRSQQVAAARELLQSLPEPQAGSASEMLYRRLQTMLSMRASTGMSPPVLMQRADNDEPVARSPAAGAAPAPQSAAIAAPAPRPEASPLPRPVDMSGTSLLGIDVGTPLPGISLVTACMNRLQNLLKVLPSWLATSADEIVIVDWSSNVPVEDALAGITDPRIRIVRIDNEPRWILTHAFNVGLRFATREVVYKLDCDIELEPGFIEANRFGSGQFARGFWKTAVDAGESDQRYTNGTFGASKRDLRAIGYFDERILTYGWDDSDLYGRLSMDLGLAGQLIRSRSLRHVEQTELQRIENQNVRTHAFLGRFAATEMEGSKNKYLTVTNTPWGSYSSSQDYRLVEQRAGVWQGGRSTRPIAPPADLARLASSLAIRQLVQWNGESTPELPTSLLARVDFAELLARAHANDVSERVIAALRAAKGVHFVRCSEPALQPALRKTLTLIADHSEEAQDRVVIYEATGDIPTRGPSATHLPASEPLISTLAELCRAASLGDASLLEDTLALGSSTCTLTTIDFDSLTDEIARKADSFALRLQEHFSTSDEFVANSAMVTSLYDEHNLIRLVEYLTCVVLNLRVFERVVVCYESRDGVLHAILRRLATRLEVDLGRLMVLPFDARPTFEQLFEVRRLFRPDTIVAAANADIAFDASFHKLRQIDMESTITVLSRWDVTRGGTGATLIRLSNGTPNTFSADAWITNGAFAPDFFLDYPIGTMHCDSFINNQVGLSSKYKVINPCLDVKVFHLHDERFNSSAQKQVRDLEEIQRKYAIERMRNGDQDPIRGVGWSSIKGATQLDARQNLQRWRPKAVVVDMSGGAQLGGLLIVHLLRSFLEKETDLVVTVRLSPDEALGRFGELLCRYQAHFNADALLIDRADEPFDAVVAQSEGVSIVRMDAREIVDCAGLDDLGALPNRLFELTRWPATPDTKMLRAEIVDDLDSRGHVALVESLSRRFWPVVESLLGFARSLDPWSPERALITPFIDDIADRAYSSPASRAVSPASARVSFVTSLFRGGAYLRGYLENVALAAEKAGGEVIIVDANVDDDHDAAVVQAFMKENPSLARRMAHVRLDGDPGLYNCWRLAIERSNAPLVSNANIDDRRSPWHTVRLLEALDRHPELAGACGSISCVGRDGAASWFAMTENAVWYHGEGSRSIGLEDLYLKDPNGEIRSRNVMHCMPVWRKDLHEKHGERFWFEQDAFGRYYMNPGSHNRRNDPLGLKELRIARDRLGAQQASIVKQ